MQTITLLTLGAPMDTPPEVTAAIRTAAERWADEAARCQEIGRQRRAATQQTLLPGWRLCEFVGGCWDARLLPVRDGVQEVWAGDPRFGPQDHYRLGEDGAFYLESSA